MARTADVTISTHWRDEARQEAKRTFDSIKNELRGVESTARRAEQASRSLGGWLKGFITLEMARRVGHFTLELARLSDQGSTSVDRLTSSWNLFKDSLAEDLSGPISATLNALAAGIDQTSRAMNDAKRTWEQIRSGDRQGYFEDMRKEGLRRNAEKYGTGGLFDAYAAPDVRFYSGKNIDITPTPETRRWQKERLQEEAGRQQRERETFEERVRTSRAGTQVIGPETLAGEISPEEMKLFQAKIQKDREKYWEIEAEKARMAAEDAQALTAIESRLAQVRAEIRQTEYEQAARTIDRLLQLSAHADTQFGKMLYQAQSIGMQFATGDWIGGTLNAINGVVAAIVGQGGAREAHLEYMEAIRQSARALKEARQNATELGENLYNEMLLPARMNLLQPLFNLYSGIEQQRAAHRDIYQEEFGINAAAMQQLDALNLFFKELVAGAGSPQLRQAIEGGGFAVVDWLYQVRNLFGIEGSDLQTLGRRMFDVRDAFLEVDSAAAKLVAGLDPLVLAMQARFDVEEMALRRQAQEQFRQAGADPFAQAQVVRSLFRQIEDLARIRQSERGGSVAGSAGKSAVGGGGEASGASDPFNFGPQVVNSFAEAIQLPGRDRRIEIAWEDAVYIHDKYGEGGRRPQGWADVVVAPGWEQRITRDWEEAIYLRDKYGENGRRPDEWADIVQLSDIPRIERSWSDAINLAKLTIDDWSDILIFPALPKALQPITINAGGDRDLIRIQRLTIDDWSDLLNFPQLPARLQPITIGVQGHPTLQYDRDLIRIQRLTIDDWSDLLNFPQLPALLQPITIGVQDHPTLQHDRDLIRIQRLTIDDWSDLLIFPQLPKAVSVAPNQLLQLANVGRLSLGLWDVFDFWGSDLFTSAYGLRPPLITLEPARLFSLGENRLKVDITDIIDLGRLEQIIINVVQRAQRDRQLPSSASGER